MKTQTPKWAIWARSLLVLPVAALLLYGFSTREVVERENKDLPKKESSLVQEKVTPEMLEEYNKLAKYYNSLSEEHSVVRMKDLDRMRYIYKLMTPEQKKNAEPLPSIYPPPPPPPPAPPVAGTETVPSPPPVPPAPTVSGMEIPGPPPPPPSPVEHIKELAAKGARFFHAGVGEISAETALKMVKNKNVSIRVRDYGSETSVHISVEK